jgi:hypothetical protein
MKIVGSRPDEINEYFSIDLVLPAVIGLRIYSVSSRNEYQKRKNTVSGEYSATGE